jgi:phosphopantetheinyl transferase (holo-ACP synthase)
MSERHPGGWTMAFDRWTDLVAQGMAARSFLGVNAHTEYEQLPAVRRKQWLLGRIAVKDAVRFRQWEAGHTDVYPIELTVCNEASGAPRVVPRPGRGLIQCNVSLAHCAEVGVAIAAPASGSVDAAPGIDVVEIAARDDTTIRYALTDQELVLLDRLGGDRDLWFARFWVAKEAVGKSRGTGLDGAPRHFVVQDADLTVAVGGQLYRVAAAEIQNPPELPPRRYVVGWTWGPSHNVETREYHHAG